MSVDRVAHGECECWYFGTWMKCVIGDEEAYDDWDIGTLVFELYD